MRVTTLIPTCDVKGGAALCYFVGQFTCQVLTQVVLSHAVTASSVQCLRLALTRQSLWTAVEWASSLELVRGRGGGDRGRGGTGEGEGQGREGGMGEGEGGTGEGGGQGNGRDRGGRVGWGKGRDRGGGGTGEGGWDGGG